MAVDWVDLTQITTESSGAALSSTLCGGAEYGMTAWKHWVFARSRYTLSETSSFLLPYSRTTTLRPCVSHNCCSLLFLEFQVCMFCFWCASSDTIQELERCTTNTPLNRSTLIVGRVSELEKTVGHRPIVVMDVVLGTATSARAAVILAMGVYERSRCLSPGIVVMRV